MPATNGNTIKWISILSGIFIVLVGGIAAMSRAGDAKLDAEKTDKSVYNQHIESDKVLRNRDYEQMQLMDKKLDRLLEK